MFSACSSDDSGSNTNPETNFESTISISGVAFIPGGSSDVFGSPLVTSLTEGTNNGLTNVRTFHMIQTGAMGDIAAVKSLNINLLYPINQTSINGTYGFEYNENNPTADPYILGSYMQGMNMEAYAEGTITVTDLGNNKFKLVFNNVVTNGGKTITGSIEGTFELDTDDSE
ncbi:MAG: hypothetical protein EOO46_07755 [Flavobacterium sp.]|nr:MAG: hypothetical protein EOO46_07755 [Flavobacterium sp.]